MSGAIRLRDNKYMYPKYASKADNFKCPDCNEHLILRQGLKNVYHFSHKKKSKCEFYNGGESAIHKDVKHYFANIIQNDGIIFYKKCAGCLARKTITVRTGVQTFVEHRFYHRDKLRVADIMIISGEKILPVEIFVTHRTREGDRPEPWVEIRPPMPDDDIRVVKCHRFFTCTKCQYNNWKVKMASVLQQLILIFDEIEVTKNRAIKFFESKSDGRRKRKDWKIEMALVLKQLHDLFKPRLIFIDAKVENKQLVKIRTNCEPGKHPCYLCEIPVELRYKYCYRCSRNKPNK